MLEDLYECQTAVKNHTCSFLVDVYKVENMIIELKSFATKLKLVHVKRYLIYATTILLCALSSKIIILLETILLVLFKNLKPTH